MRALLSASVATLAAAVAMAMAMAAAGPQDHKPDVLTGGPKRDLFVVQRDGVDRIAQGYKSGYGQKIRLGGFGLTDFETLRRNLRQAGRDAALDLPGGQTLFIPNTSVDSLGEDTFQLELDRRGLVQTFADDFQDFSWYSEPGDGQPRRGTWRTHFGYGGDPNAIGARSLGSVKDLQVYVDPSFRGTAGKPLGLNPFRTQNGILEITADRTPDDLRDYMWQRPFISGLITSRFSFSQRYGVFEIRARIPSGRGLWPAFWLLPVNGGWPPEIDILEILGHDTGTLYSSWHSKAAGKHTSETVTSQLPDMSADFHTYSVEWRSSDIRWYFDDVEIGRRATPPDLDKPMYILANLGVGGSWPGYPDATTQFPAIFAIDWIRAYRRDNAH